MTWTPYSKIICILLITNALLIGYSVLDVELEVFGLELKKGKYIKQKYNILKTKDLIDSIEAIKDTVIKEKTLDTSSQKILLTGDSMSEGIYWWFRHYCKHNNHEIKTVPWFSSATIGWAGSDSLRKLIAKHKPTYVILCLGSNELFIRNVEDREPAIQGIISQVDSVPFVWVGPPNWKEDTGLNDLIMNNLGEKQFFLSKHFKLPRRKDGAHPTTEGYLTWTDTLCKWLEHSCEHPIKMQKPTNL